MTRIEALLSDIRHRPFDLPTGKWAYHQEWNNTLFLHWKVSFDAVRELVPKNLKLDTFDGEAYVSLVVFTMQKVRPRNLPALKLISDFDEINLRTYVEHDHKKGVYFLSIEAGKKLSAFMARTLSDLPYEKSNIRRGGGTCKSTNFKKHVRLDTEFEVTGRLHEKTDLDKWLTERYCLYRGDNHTLYRYDIHHQEWDIKNIKIHRLELNYNLGGVRVTDKPHVTHYSNGVKVIAWRRTKIQIEKSN